MRRLIAVSLALVAMPVGGVPAATAAGPADRYIVVLTDEAATRGLMRAEDFRISRVDGRRVGDRVSELRARHGIRPDRIFRAVVPGFAARLTRAQVDALRADPAVADVVPDLPVSLDDMRSADDAAGIVSTSLDSGPVVPTGIRRVRADASPIARIDGIDQRVRGNAAVLDTGIASHRDLVVAGGRNCTDQGGPSAWADRNGHGTHVAGTIGALDNARGVVGVAPGVNLWAVKVLNDSAKGYTSWIICGLDFVARKKKADGSRFFDVVNVSISGPLDSRGACGSTKSPYQAATCRVVAAGIPVVVAAGNKSRDARFYRPAAYENVITVSALADFDGKPGGNGRQADICPFYSPDQDDTFADFSNFGADVDLMAPGKCILSTYLGGRYAWMSGTSMASPHVAGAVVLYRTEYPDAGPLQTKQALQAAGTFDWRTGTDPDGQPDRLLRVVPSGPPPTFQLGISEPVAYLGRDTLLRVPVDPGRKDGHREPIRLTASGLPREVSALASIIRGADGELRLRSTTDVSGGEHVVKVRGTDGELKSATRFTLRIDAQRPKAGFTTPDKGTSRLTDRPEQALVWTESDTGGSGLASRTVQHQTAGIVTPGSCEGLTWVDTGKPITSPSPATATDLAPGLCHRWRLRLLDGARNSASAVSGTSLIDTTPPPGPSFIAEGERIHQSAPGQPVWFGAGKAGSLSLLVRSVDAHSGTRDLRTTALDPPGGWTGPGARTSSGTQASLSLSWARGAAATSLRARATDRLGHEGPWRTLDLLPDDTDPVSATWTSPATGSMGFSDGSVRIEYGGGSDTGSGLDPVASIALRQAAVVSEGTCEGVSFSPAGSAARRASGSTLTGLSSDTCYRWVLTSHDRVGNAGASRTSGMVLVDSIAPGISFASPVPGGASFDDDGRVSVTFTLTERGGSGLAASELRRQVAPVVEPGSCAGVTWTNDGAAVTITRSTTSLDERGLLSGRCYRWQVRAADRAGNERVKRSAAVLVDTAPPPPAEVSVLSGGAWAESSSGPVWFRAGVSGSFVLRSEPRQDPASGITGSRFGALSPQAGWSRANTTAAFVAGRPADRTYGHSAGAGDGAFRLTSRDRAGNDGPALEVSLRADDQPPALTISSPARGTTRLPRDRVIIEFEARDAGSGIATRRLAQQRGRVRGADDCSAVDWSNDGSAFTASSGMVIDDLKAGWCYRWRLTVRDRVGNAARATTGAVRLDDGIALDVDDIGVRLRAGQVGHSKVSPGRLSWVVETVLAGATVSHDVAATRDGGRTWDWLARAARRSRLDVRLDPRRGLIFAVRARDSDGHRSAWEESDRIRVRLLEETEPGITWAGAWKQVKPTSASGGALRRSRDVGATARLTFEGIGAALVTELGPRAGTVILRVDGKTVARRSLRRTTSSPRQALVMASFAEPGVHDIEVVVAGDGVVAVDGFLVLRAFPTSVQR